MQQSIIDQRLSGSETIKVIQQGSIRQLYINDVLQSEIDPQHPEKLISPVNHSILSALMFTPATNILLAGGGGGALIHWCLHKLPDSHGVCCEINPDIIDIAKQWFDLADMPDNWQWQQADIANYIKQTNRFFDLLIIDFAAANTSPEFISSASFLKNCYQRLSDSGVLVLNFLASSNNHFLNALATIRQQFNGRTCCLPVPGFDNIIIIASKSKNSLPSAHQLQHLTQKYSLDFASQIQRIKQNNPAGSGLY